MHTDSANRAIESVLDDLMAIGRTMRRRMVGDGLDPGLFWLLKTVGDSGTLRLTELAACANLDTSTVSRHVAQMQRAGLVERAPDPDDGRAQRVMLTDHGRRAFEQAQSRRRALVADALHDWDATDLDRLQELLGRLVDGLQAGADEGHPHPTTPRAS